MHHSDRGVKYTMQLAEAGIKLSIESVDDIYDNALTETINGLYKPRTSIGAGLGGTSKRSNSTLWNGSIGLTTDAPRSKPETYRKPKLKSGITPRWTNTHGLKWPQEPGAVQSAHQIGLEPSL